MLTFTWPPGLAASAALVMRLVKTCLNSAGNADTEIGCSMSVDTLTFHSINRRSISNRISCSISFRSITTGAFDSR